MNVSIKQIVKRDGRTVDFDINKIVTAIYKAAEALGGRDEEMALYLAREVELYLAQTCNNDSPTVEEIQDAVEKILIENGHARTAKEFILYRAERTRVRDMNTRLMKIYEDLTFKDASENDTKRENANIDGDTAMGTMLKYGSEGAKQFYEMYVLKPEHGKAHREGDIHIHDLDFLTLTTTCCQIEIEKLFKNGFSTGHGFLREPNDIQSYAALACIAIQSNQNDQHGGQSIPDFDYGMSNGVRKTFKKLYWTNLGKLMDMTGEVLMAKGLIERIGLKGSVIKHEKEGCDKVVKEVPMNDHKEAIKQMLEMILDPECGVLKNMSELGAVGHRVVHAGEKYSKSVIITDDVIKALEECVEMAPLHNPPNLLGIAACKELMPNTPMVGVFDTAFHQTMKRVKESLNNKGMEMVQVAILVAIAIALGLIFRTEITAFIDKTFINLNGGF